MPKQTCEMCRWFHRGSVLKGNPCACYLNGKWKKWIKKDSEDKPNTCLDFEV